MGAGRQCARADGATIKLCFHVHRGLINSVCISLQGLHTAVLVCTGHYSSHGCDFCGKILVKFNPGFDAKFINLGI